VGAENILYFQDNFPTMEEAGDWLSRSSASADGIVCLYVGNRYDSADSHVSSRATCGLARDIKRDSLAWHRSAKITFSGIAENRGFFQQDQAANLRGKCSKMRKFGAPPGPALTAPR
jgi:hypothetical protein